MSHQLTYQIDKTQQKPFQLKCSGCCRFIRMSFVAFYFRESEKTTARYFAALAGEECQP